MNPRVSVSFFPAKAIFEISPFTNRKNDATIATVDGALAQLVAHHTGSVGVSGSNPLCSTETGSLADIGFRYSFVCVWEKQKTNGKEARSLRLLQIRFRPQYTSSRSSGAMYIGVPSVTEG